MKMEPTYTAQQVKAMCMNLETEHATFKILVDLIDEEFNLYSDEDLIILMQASMIMFSRSLLKLSLKNIQ